MAAIGLASAGCLSTRGPSVPLAANAPDFTLKDQTDRDVSLSSLVKNGPAVLVFYRGFW